MVPWGDCVDAHEGAGEVAAEVAVEEEPTEGSVPDGETPAPTSSSSSASRWDGKHRDSKHTRI